MQAQGSRMEEIEAAVGELSRCLADIGSRLRDLKESVSSAMLGLSLQALEQLLATQRSQNAGAESAPLPPADQLQQAAALEAPTVVGSSSRRSPARRPSSPAQQPSAEASEPPPDASAAAALSEGQTQAPESAKTLTPRGTSRLTSAAAPCAGKPAEVRTLIQALKASQPPRDRRVSRCSVSASHSELGAAGESLGGLCDTGHEDICEAKADWMCNVCTFRRTGLPLIKYGSNEKCFKCKLHKGVCFKQVVPDDAPNRSTKRKPPGGEPSAAGMAKLEKRLQSLEAENQCLRAPQDGAAAADETNGADELREEIDGLAKHVQWLGSVKLPWAAQPLLAAREQLEAARRKLYDTKPLPAKLTALSRRAEQARQRLQKAEQDKLAADKALAAAQLAATSAANVVEERKKTVEDLEEDVRALSSQPAPQPMAVDLTGPEFHICEEKLLACLGAMEGVSDASKLAPKLVEALKSRAAELLEEPSEKKTKRETSQPPSQDVADFVAENAEEPTLREKAMQLAAGGYRRVVCTAVVPDLDFGSGRCSDTSVGSRFRAGSLGLFRAEIVHGGGPTCNDPRCDCHIASDIAPPFIRSAGVIEAWLKCKNPIAALMISLLRICWKLPGPFTLLDDEGPIAWQSISEALHGKRLAPHQRHSLRGVITGVRGGCLHLFSFSFPEDVVDDGRGGLLLRKPFFREFGTVLNLRWLLILLALRIALVDFFGSNGVAAEGALVGRASAVKFCKKFWGALKGTLHELPARTVPVMLLDASARVGSELSVALGTHSADQENAGGVYFRETLEEHHLRAVNRAVGQVAFDAETLTRQSADSIYLEFHSAVMPVGTKPAAAAPDPGIQARKRIAVEDGSTEKKVDLAIKLGVISSQRTRLLEAACTTQFTITVAGPIYQAMKSAFETEYTPRVKGQKGHGLGAPDSFMFAGVLVRRLMVAINDPVLEATVVQMSNSTKEKATAFTGPRPAGHLELEEHRLVPASRSAVPAPARDSGAGRKRKWQEELSGESGGEEVNDEDMDEFRKRVAEEERQEQLQREMQEQRAAQEKAAREELERRRAEEDRRGASERRRRSPAQAGAAGHEGGQDAPVQDLVL
ncbi:unnamed protein product [Prorocentrum cordatum]|uniref:Uncharacterized protein n=1 Tax=Prorocentrum cordatum TaxID=2364126 RepID=A0ABN9VIA1_9DINO|nr:unnamed protein product [Polarella glacialis]